jgi:hypothetical protein
MPRDIGQPIAMPRKFRVVQNLAELQIVYRNTMPLFYDETGNPNPHGSFIRLPDGRLPRHGNRWRRNTSRGKRTAVGRLHNYPWRTPTSDPLERDGQRLERNGQLDLTDPNQRRL